MVNDYLYLYTAFLLLIYVCLLAALTRGPIYVCCILHNHQCLLDLRHSLETHVTLACTQFLTNYPKPMVSCLNANGLDVTPLIIIKILTGV